MRFNKRPKAGRMRGSMSHGYGSKKKHRGAGNRGGVGMAGSGKRADTKKPALWKKPYFGKHGFKHKNAIRIKAVNIAFIEANLEKLEAKRGKGGVELNLTKIGYHKLLGTGSPSQRYVITVDYASKGAKQKIEKAGGKLKLSTPKIPKQPSRETTQAEEGAPEANAEPEQGIETKLVRPATPSKEPAKKAK